MTEEGDELVIHASCETGENMKLYYKPWDAHRLGEGIMEKARHMVAKAGDDPARTEPFNLEARDAPMRQV